MNKFTALLASLFVSGTLCAIQDDVYPDDEDVRSTFEVADIAEPILIQLYLDPEDRASQSLSIGSHLPPSASGILDENNGWSISLSEHTSPLSTGNMPDLELLATPQADAQGSFDLTVQSHYVGSGGFFSWSRNRPMISQRYTVQRTGQETRLLPEQSDDVMRQSANYQETTVFRPGWCQWLYLK